MTLNMPAFEWVHVLLLHLNSGISFPSPDLCNRATLSALRMADSDTNAYVADTVIKRINDREFLNQVINDGSQIDTVVTAINNAIKRLGDRVLNELSDFRNVNRIWLVGGGAELIEPYVRNGWKLPAGRIVLVSEPQTALVQEMALFKQEE
ncbi:plasmid segregation protein ParM domain-containing protein [Serratia sp. M24T3]|uniref:plasmid segregation protein ParM domain-containing protein n=1 Tax=Serratia sp. M24T3 TaxID=932213 RepID=UPI000A033F73